MAPATERLRRTSRGARLLHASGYLTTLALLLTGWWLLAGGEGSPSPLAKILDVPDTRVHVWFGWGLAVVLAMPLVVRWKGVVAFVRETFRVDGGDGRWWLRWPMGILTGSPGTKDTSIRVSGWPTSSWSEVSWCSPRQVSA